MIETVIAVLGIGAALVILAAYGMNGVIANNQAKIADANSELRMRFGDGDYHTVLPGPRCVGIAWGQGALILGDSVEEGKRGLKVAL